MNAPTPAYGLWIFVVLNAALFILFAFSFTHPRTTRDWRAFGAFSAFVLALFTEMYGFPLTLYLLSGWLGRRYPDLGLFSHNSGHLWETLLGTQGDPHLILQRRVGATVSPQPRNEERHRAHDQRPLECASA